MFHPTYKQLFAIVFVAAVVAISLFSSLTSDYHKKAAVLAQLKAENTQLQAEYEYYQRELSFVQSDAGVELFAHQYGWQYPDETCYSAIQTASH